MPFSAMCRCLVLVWTDVSEESITSIFWVGWLQPSAHAFSSPADIFTPKMEAIRSSEASVHIRSTRRHIPENGILQTDSVGEAQQQFTWPTHLWNWAPNLTNRGHRIQCVDSSPNMLQERFMRFYISHRPWYLHIGDKNLGHVAETNSVFQIWGSRGSRY
jgi:hypothetical protein